jgi:hypothetical protein
MTGALIAGVFVGALISSSIAHGAMLVPTRVTQPDAGPQDAGASLATLAEAMLDDPRLSAPFPCVAPWVATGNLVLIATPAGQQAGFRPGDRITRIGTTPVTVLADGTWEAALRKLSGGLTSYYVEVERGSASVTVIAPCGADEAATLYEAERAMLTAASGQDWDGCLRAGQGMTAALGMAVSRQLRMMAACARAGDYNHDDQGLIVFTLGRTLLLELQADPARPKETEQLIVDVLRDLEQFRATGGQDYASKLRALMKDAGVGTVRGPSPQG